MRRKLQKTSFLWTFIDFCDRTNKCVLASSGMQADIATLHKQLLIRLEMYKHQNGREMSTTSIAQLLGNTLYGKRFFPYYTFNVLGGDISPLYYLSFFFSWFLFRIKRVLKRVGVDDNGVGCAYSYDAVGSFERTPYSSSGTGQSLVQPLLDNQVFSSFFTSFTILFSFFILFTTLF